MTPSDIEKSRRELEKWFEASVSFEFNADEGTAEFFINGESYETYGYYPEYEQKDVIDDFKDKLLTGWIARQESLVVELPRTSHGLISITSVIELLQSAGINYRERE
jgi:hypothetical protein